MIVKYLHEKDQYRFYPIREGDTGLLASAASRFGWRRSADGSLSVPGFQLESIPQAIVKACGLGPPTRRKTDPWNLLHVPDALRLYPFQVEDVLNMVEPGGWGCWLDCGLGKTVEAIVAYRILRRKGLVDGILVIGPEAGRHAWCKSSNPDKPSIPEKFLDEEGFWVKRGKDIPTSGIVYVTGDKTFRAPYFEEISARLKSKRWILCIDECFPHDTEVDTDLGKLPIGKIVDEKLNVKVLSKNLLTGGLEWKPVIRWLNRGRKSTLCRVTYDGGQFICTPEHKVWTEKGYVEAANLLNDNVLMVRHNVYAPARWEKIAHEEILLQVMQRPAYGEQAGAQKENSRCGSSPFSRNAGEQSDEKSSHQGQGWSCIKGEAFSSQAWGKWSHHALPTVSAQFCISRAANGNDPDNTQKDTSRNKNPKPLQNRPSLPATETSCGDRRVQSRDITRPSAGQKERYCTSLVRVVRVEIIESADPSGTTVYDLEVEGNHNFFANGTLVSNCHLFSGAFSKRFNILDLWAEWCPWRWLMSGTWQSNYPDTAWPIYRLITRSDVTLEEWTRWFGKSDRTWREDRLAQYGRYQRRFSSVRTKRLPNGTPNPDICPHLPAVSRTILRVPLESRQRELYEQVLKEGRAVFAERSINAQSFWHRLVHLSSIASHPLVSDESNYGTISKLRILEELLRTIGDQKACIWSWHPDVLEWLCSCLAERSVVYHGSVSKTQREQAVYRFNNDPACRYFLGNPSAAGMSLNLQAGSVRIFWDQHWEWHELEQARERIDRIDNVSGVPITEYVLLGAGTIEEVVYEANEAKHNFQRLVNGQDKEAIWTSPVVGNIFERWNKQ